MNNKFVLYDTLTPWYLKLVAYPFLTLLDILLNNEQFAQRFFDQIRTEDNIRTTLQSVYVNKDRVDDELVQSILKPAYHPNALKVFVRILTGHPGTTPDKLLPYVTKPVKLVWGSQDPFTPLTAPYGRLFSEFAAKEGNRVELSIVEGGHCPHSDSPDEVHAVIFPWLESLRCTLETKNSP
jgi:pimeloyl-ACP methyl ester carboxylesterase